MFNVLLFLDAKMQHRGWLYFVSSQERKAFQITLVRCLLGLNLKRDTVFYTTLQKRNW